MTEHTCRAKNCDLSADSFMCELHWGMVPTPFRAAIEASEDPRTCTTTIALAAIDAVAHKESRQQKRTAKQPAAPTPKPARTSARKPTRKPVQLELF
ncbi:hypothetical protein [Mycolicibacterium llatzerense]|uniref:hypothetical protein n=1 Tax=Mycolicibacterium llatzerense TaxID=280871 RepID=UPI0031D5C6A2